MVQACRAGLYTTRFAGKFGSLEILAERFDAEEVARRSKAASGDQPRGSSPGSPWPERGVSWKLVPSSTVPAGMLMLRFVAVKVPPADPIETGLASGVRRASTGTVPTPSCTKTSRSTVVVAGAALEAVTNRCESLTCSE